ncbi:hypothetical protein ACI7BZ_06165 [Xanthobacter sp. AM11]|uniref:hypothetical protein n=1 Tax=Xanthobacter sp. AM11 TaxID=3380643 RepID=UPI0039BF5B78
MTSAFTAFMTQLNAEGREKADGIAEGLFRQMTPEELRRAAELLSARAARDTTAIEALGHINLPEAADALEKIFFPNEFDNRMLLVTAEAMLRHEQTKAKGTSALLEFLGAARGDAGEQILAVTSLFTALGRQDALNVLERLIRIADVGELRRGALKEIARGCLYLARKIADMNDLGSEFNREINKFADGDRQALTAIIQDEDVGSRLSRSNRNSEHGLA